MPPIVKMPPRQVKLNNYTDLKSGKVMDKAALDEAVSAAKKDADLQALADSIKQEGQMMPIGVDKDTNLVYGLRRLLACLAYNIDSINTTLAEPLAALMAPIPHRRPATREDMIHAVKRLRQQGLTVAQIVATTLLSESTVRRYLKTPD